MRIFLRSPLSLWLSFIGLLCLNACNSAQDSMTNLPTIWPISYEIFVQSYADGNGDGIGDFKGLTAKLDYLADLGIGAIWLMPIHPSPSYHKYDVLNYYEVHPDYGTLAEFKELLQAAHARNIRVIIDLVLNHSSDLHPWFVEARKGKDNPYRDYYVWTSEAEEMAKDPEWHWHALKDSAGNIVDNEKYYGFFWHGMPDLNMANPKVRAEIIEIARFWLKDIGVDGFRLDAAKFIFREDQPQKNHSWWKYFGDELRKIKADVYLVAEVWDGPQAIAPYLEGLDACFNFKLSDLILGTAAKGRDSLDLLNNYMEIRKIYEPYRKDQYVDATFLANHDQNRSMTQLGNRINRAKMAASLLLTLPGTPYIYYGEEIGMLGKKPDEYIREPFLWAPQGVDTLQTSWEVPLYSSYENVEPLSFQVENKHSLYHHYKKLIALRKNSYALSFGDIEAYPIKGDSLLAYARSFEQEKLLIIHNLGGRRKSLPLPLQQFDLSFYTRKPNLNKKDSVELASFSTIILTYK